MTLIVHTLTAWYYLDVTSTGVYLVTIGPDGSWRDRYASTAAAREAAHSYVTP